MEGQGAKKYIIEEGHRNRYKKSAKQCGSLMVLPMSFVHTGDCRWSVKDEFVDDVLSEIEVGIDS